MGTLISIFVTIGYVLCGLLMLLFMYLNKPRLVSISFKIALFSLTLGLILIIINKS